MVTVWVVTSYLRITPQGRGNSPKSDDDERIGQIFVYVVAGSNGFEPVAVLRPSMIHDSAFFFRYLLDIFCKFVAHFQTYRTHTRTQKRGFIFRYRTRRRKKTSCRTRCGNDRVRQPSLSHRRRSGTLAISCSRCRCRPLFKVPSQPIDSRVHLLVRFIRFPSIHFHSRTAIDT